MKGASPSQVVCPYCQAEAKLVTGSVIYPSKFRLQDKWFWLCRPCEAWVGCHDRGTWSINAEGKRVSHFGVEPIGRLANAELRAWKMRAHAAFDPLWRDGGPLSRRAAYAWLHEAMGFPPGQEHIGQMDVADCQRMEKLCAELRARLRTCPDAATQYVA